MYRDVLDPGRVVERRRAYVSYILHLLGTLSLVTLAAASKGSFAPKLLKTFFRARKFERRRLHQALKRLEKRGLVRRQQRDDGNEYLLLTEAGERIFFYEKHRVLTLRQPGRWDTFWRIVIFDINENKKTARDAIRRHLRNLGFLRLQKSVFVTPYPCDEEVQFLQKFYESGGSIYLILAVSLGEKEKEFRKHFGL